MSTLNSILVAVDFSAGACAALKEAARLSALHGARLSVCHVVDSGREDSWAGNEGAVAEGDAGTEVQRARVSLALWLEQAQAPANTHVMVSVGSPVEEILERAQALGVDLVVAGVSGAGKSQAKAGSVASRLARKGGPYILLVSLGNEMSHAVRKITACIDFSDASREVAEAARQLALREGAHVDFLHVWNEPWLGLSYDAPVKNATKFRDGYIQDLRGSLKEFVSDARRGIESSEVLYNASNHGCGIASYAEESRSDLIMMGGKGRTNLEYMLLGSITEHMLGPLPCSLLVVKQPGG